MAKLSADLGWGPAVTNGNKQIGMLGGYATDTCCGFRPQRFQ